MVQLRAALGEAMGEKVTQTYDERSPTGGIQAVVSSVWVQTVAADADPYVHRDIPHGGFELRFASTDGLQIVGPQTVPTSNAIAPGGMVVGLRFKAGTASAVLGVPGAELVDLRVPAHELLGTAGRRLAEQLFEAEGPEQAAALLQRHVMARLGDTEGIDPVIEWTLGRLAVDTNTPIAHLAAGLGVSPRHLRRRCHEAVGLSPKALQRVRRFQVFQARAQRNLARGRDPADGGLAAMAVAAGYADQAHLSRECVRLTGLPPGAWLHQMVHQCEDHDHSAAFTPLTQ